MAFDRQHQQTLFDLINLNPWLDEDRAKYDDGAVFDAILCDAKSVRRKYSFKWGATLYPLQQIVALGGSPATVNLCAHPGAVLDADYDGRTPLHTACDAAALVETVVLLVDAYPPAMEAVNRWGQTPLHVACKHCAPEAVLRLLVDRCPEAVGIRDGNGNTALSLYLEGNGHGARLDVVRFLAGRCGPSLEWKDDFGSTPLHIACENFASLEVLEFLAEEHPIAMESMDGDGATPLQLLELRDEREEERMLLKTLHAVFCLRPNDAEISAMLLDDTGMSWRSRAVPILRHRPLLVHRVGVPTQVKPTLLEKVVLDGRVQTTFRIVRESMDIFEDCVRVIT